MRQAQLGPATAGTLCQCLASIVNNNTACVLILQQDLSSISSEISEAFSIISNDFQNCTSMIEFLEKKILPDETSFLIITFGLLDEEKNVLEFVFLMV